MKRTIAENHKLRLEAQFEEAKIQALTKTANALSGVLERNEVRPDDSFYVYASDDLEEDVDGVLWDAATRISDYLGVVPDSQKLQSLLKRHAEELFQEICALGGVSDGVGAHEPNVPGENRRVVMLEVEEKE